VVPQLVALALPGGAEFRDAVQQIWDRGDAVAPIDPDAPTAFRDELLAALSPSSVIDASGEEHPLDGGRPVEPGDALVIATSGTSGRPKGAVLTHDAIEAHAYASATAIGIDPDAVWLACLPLHHIGGFGVVARALRIDAGLVVHPRFDAAAVMAAARAGATHTSLVPTALGRIDPAAFRAILLGGTAIPVDRPANTIATYGMTESCGGVVYDGLTLNGVGLQVDSDGAIALSGPTMMRAYRDGTVPFDEHGWFATGDLGSVDPSTGHLTVWGRSDDVIVTGGEKVWPDRVEAVLRDARAIGVDLGIGDVAVVGRPDPEWGSRVVAVVVAADPAAPPSLETIREQVKAVLPSYCAPKSLELVEVIPRTALGKIRRSAL
jgi:O-succinylbenzoic acid--CoA ligase